ncbi:NADH-quinone oxidoreductase subunit NuoK [Alienimonas chondri]|uniref:NADH-quinone oxidoreductase subunit K n=1 Tax=Alienimonas chondri TaxID=2681879 RepID=A0ABX1VG25_9PLAN|nr:NADH-quinone oxidoreductase subunit NuoK [Alienimonas chondri]NNJ26704.1 NADH-quinone oxidoreductase subunit K [Alienimonas chondri]
MTGYLIVSAVLLTCGVVCMASKRNAVGVLMGVELVLNAASVNFVAAAEFGPPAVPVQVATADAIGVGLDGQIAALFVIVLAAAEAAVALAIVLAFFNQHGTADVDAASELRG